jgi:hypothetical protein
MIRNDDAPNNNLGKNRNVDAQKKDDAGTLTPAVGVAPLD